jgi:hypothetical protein
MAAGPAARSHPELLAQDPLVQAVAGIMQDHDVRRAVERDLDAADGADCFYRRDFVQAHPNEPILLPRFARFDIGKKHRGCQVIPMR